MVAVDAFLEDCGLHLGVEFLESGHGVQVHDAGNLRVFSLSALVGHDSGKGTDEIGGAVDGRHAEHDAVQQATDCVGHDVAHHGLQHAVGLVERLVAHGDGDADALGACREFGETNLSVAQSGGLGLHGSGHGLIHGPHKVTRQTGAEGQANQVKNKAFLERLQDFLDSQGNDFSAAHIGHGHNVATKNNLGLTAMAGVLADKTQCVGGSVGVCTQVLGCCALHLHLKQLVLADERVKLVVLGLVAHAVLALALLCNLIHTVTIDFITVNHFAHIDFFHSCKSIF